MQDIVATTVLNERLEPCYWLLRLGMDNTPPVKPGQFAMVKPRGQAEPILRRALAIYRAGPGSVDFVYQVLGRGTQALTHLRPGHEVEVLLPLGNGFELTDDVPARHARVVMGGVGSAGLLMLAAELAARGGPVTVYYGGRTQYDLPGWRDFEGLGLTVIYTTDDGSRGEHARVTVPLERDLGGAAGPSTIYACGPWPMMARTAEIARTHSIPCFVSLESHMACGFGICVACVVEVVEGCMPSPFKYQKVCTEGPIFPAGAIRW